MMGWFKKDPLQIISFQSYGRSDHFYIRGRALEDENIDLSKRGFFSLLKNTWKRFEADEIPEARLKIHLPDNTFLYTQTNAKGYFKCEADLLKLDLLSNDEGWLNFSISFEDQFPDRVINNDNVFSGEMLIPSQKSSFGIISDIDDTILHTGLTSLMKLKVLKNTFFKRATHRTPLEGASAFYHMLHRGSTGKEANPCFYVSHSPWNLYRYLELFLKTNNFPKGPILLRNFPKPFSKKDPKEKPQKQKEILNILETYPDLPLILIGDSGEHDPDIYLEIAEAFPDRILAIYLRSVKHKRKMIRVRGLFEKYDTVPVLLVDHSRQAIEHAVENNFIRRAP
jgi:phosphatidate phosphatase APP1